MHVTFGVETALAGTYESLLHHALEVAAVQHPLLFGIPRPQGEGRGNEVRVWCFGTPMQWWRLSALPDPAPDPRRLRRAVSSDAAVWSMHVLHALDSSAW